MNGNTKKIIKILLLCSLAISNWASVFADSLVLPRDSFQFDRGTAVSLLELCTGHEEKKTAALFGEAGITVVEQKNYSRPVSQIDHTSAYTIGLGKIKRGTKIEDAILVVVRGTDGTEWFSNFDLSFSADDRSHFVSGFLSSAEDVLLDVVKIVSEKKEKNPLIVVAGHSRGGAVANILALLLNQIYNPEKIYAYTFACPMTIKNMDGLSDKNIFNIINPCDIVPNFPFSAWGFRRAGTDIFLDKKSEKVDSQKIIDGINSLSKNCPTVSSFYNDRHSLLHSGLDENGMTFYEVLMSLGTHLSALTVTSLQSEKIDLGAVDFKIPMLETGTDFSLLFKYLYRFFKNNGEGFFDLLNEHLPDVYRKKIERL